MAKRAADDHQEEPPLKRCTSPTSTAPSSPDFRRSTSPEARDHAQHSGLWQLSVKELKARLDALGADWKGVTEKEELVNLLEQSQQPSEGVPPTEL
eukprot:s3795_g2.t1